MPRRPFVSVCLSAALAASFAVLTPQPRGDARAQAEARENRAAEHDDPRTPKVGDKAHDFTLPAVAGEPVSLAGLAERGPVVLLVMRGYPGYQCPLCTRQMAGFLARAQAFKDRGASVLLVYPGPAEGLMDKAREFVADVELPDHFRFAIDPGYVFTNKYGLRWDEPRETAYPSTFIIDTDRTVAYAYISHTHGNRTDAPTILDRLAALADRGEPRWVSLALYPPRHPQAHRSAVLSDRFQDLHPRSRSNPIPPVPQSLGSAPLRTHRCSVE